MVTMKNLKLPSFFFCFFLLFLLSGASHHHHHHHRHRRNVKLFVFGDSYADTGNNRLSDGTSWKVPYGITFPGKPAGRFSDGRVLTDYVADYVGVKTPIAYRKWNITGSVRSLKNGVNFAYGGSGVFQTLATYPNMTSQISFLDQLIKKSLYTPADIKYSVALVTNSGNDYAAYTQRNGSVQGLPSFIASVVNQLAVNLKMISALGVRKIAVVGLPPLGCLPPITASTSFTQCNANQNALVSFHNQLLAQAVAKLNNETKHSTFIVLDIYTSFMSILNSTTESKFVNPLKLCCAGTSATDHCGTVDANGVKKYTVCDDPKTVFFWDDAHPTQAGWRAVYSTLRTTLKHLIAK